MSLYNADELVAPEWINADFLEIVLTKYENNETVEVGTSHTITTCLQIG